MFRFLVIILFSLLFNNVCAQKWEHALYIENHTEGRDIIESYDKGSLLLSLTYNTNNESSTFLTKYDINGDEIWSKKIGNLEDRIYSNTLKILADGSILIAGGENKLSNTTSSFLIKLNACGDLDWLKIIGDSSGDDFISDILIAHDGNILVQASYLGDEIISVLKINLEGKTLWQKDFFPLLLGGGQDYDPEIGKYHSSWVDAMINTVDGGIALSGTIYITYLLDSSLVELKSFIMKLNSEGVREWVYVHGASLPGHRTDSEDLIEVSDGYVVFGAKRFNANPQSNIRSHLYKVDKNGALLWEKEQTDTIMKTVGFGIEAFDDGTFALMTHAYTGEEIPGTNYDSWVKVYKTDTFGNVLDSAVYGKGADKNTKTLSMSKTSDNKILLAGFQDSALNRSSYALRILPDLSIDTFTNEVLNYDTLCSHSITDSFIAFDTALSIINVGKIQYELKVYPNPTQNELFFEINTTENLEYSLQLYSSLGSLVYKQENITNNLLKVNVVDLSSGLYYYTINYKGSLVGNGKFVKE